MEHAQQCHTRVPMSNKRRSQVVYEVHDSITASMDVMHNVIVSFNAPLTIMPYFTRCDGKWEGRYGGWQEKLSAQRVRVLMFSFLWVYGFPLGLCLSCEFMLFLCSFKFGYKVIWDEKGEVFFAHKAWEELWCENLFLTTTTTTAATTTQSPTWQPVRGIWKCWENLENLNTRGGV